MFGWVGRLVDRIAEGMVRRGQAIVEGGDRALEERRTAVRAVRTSLSEAMTHAEGDRENGRVEDRDGAVDAANRASSVVHEVDDDEARRLVLVWKAQFDAIPKGWKEGGYAGWAGERMNPVGYPEPAWAELRGSAEAALDRLGVVLRELLDRRK